uniref:RRM domain-containing protein n=1 Tax=Alexandrium andersonii TaxID=327968 RepID=A0A7S2I9B2_9DINO
MPGQADVEESPGGVGAAGQVEAAVDEISAKLGTSEHPIPQPEGYDTTATLVAVNLPRSASSMDVGSFFSWYAPVVHTELLDTSITGSDANFLVTFVDSASADHVLQAGIQSYEGHPDRPIRLQRLSTERKSSWFW